MRYENGLWWYKGNPYTTLRAALDVAQAEWIERKR